MTEIADRPKQKLIFLDFDGVLHSIDAIEIPALQFRHVRLLAELIEPYPEVQVVISSNWAAGHDLDSLRICLEDIGDRVIGATTGEDQRLSRFRQCEAMAERLGVTRWLMLDDQVNIVFGNENAKPHMMQRVIFCDSTLGLKTFGVTERLLSWLSE